MPTSAAISRMVAASKPLSRKSLWATFRVRARVASLASAVIRMTASYNERVHILGGGERQGKCKMNMFKKISGGGVLNKEKRPTTRPPPPWVYPGGALILHYSRRITRPLSRHHSGLPR